VAHFKALLQHLALRYKYHFQKQTQDQVRNSESRKEIFPWQRMLLLIVSYFLRAGRTGFDSRYG
jgi:hypothetical protein